MGSLPLVTIPATEIRNVSSSYVNQQFKISIALPNSYATNDGKSKKYPTIYLLDGNFYFGTVTEMTRIMAYCGADPEVIIVGIGYPLPESVEQSEEFFKLVWGVRSRDLTPFKDEEWEKEQVESLSLDYIETGGAAQYLEFVKKELIPLIDAEYRTDTSYRVLVGHSFGGLFVLHALLNETDLFQGFVAASPSLWFADRSFFSSEDNYAQTHDDLQANLYLSVGQNEEKEWGIELGMVSNLIRFSAILESRDYKGLIITNQVFENLNHCEAVGPGLQLGLKWIFSKVQPETKE